jgi:hypothetical protein
MNTTTIDSDIIQSLAGPLELAICECVSSMLPHVRVGNVQLSLTPSLVTTRNISSLTPCTNAHYRASLVLAINKSDLNVLAPFPHPPPELLIDSLGEMGNILCTLFHEQAHVYSILGYVEPAPPIISVGRINEIKDWALSGEFQVDNTRMQAGYTIRNIW